MHLYRCTINLDELVMEISFDTILLFGGGDEINDLDYIFIILIVWGCSNVHRPSHRIVMLVVQRIIHFGLVVIF